MADDEIVMAVAEEMARALIEDVAGRDMDEQYLMLKDACRTNEHIVYTEAVKGWMIKNSRWVSQNFQRFHPKNPDPPYIPKPWIVR